MDEVKILQAYEAAKAAYAAEGIDTEAAIARADAIPLSVNCWQGDDVMGFDGAESLSGGIATTGNYPGRARNLAELQADLDEAMRYFPGKKKLNLHACYAVKTRPELDRDAYGAADFAPWIDWAKAQGLGLDFNPTFFAHPMMDGNFSLSSFDEEKRRFWIEHGKACLRIADAFAKALGQASVVNFWMPDSYKDRCVDSAVRRRLMIEALDEILGEAYDREKVFPAVESKLFGIGGESHTVASHEFSLGYAISRKVTYCLDAGHFHPTEVISAKISAVMQYIEHVLLHVSRPVRWDSDHVVTMDDELQNIMDEILWNDYEGRIFFGTDFFDASINRLAAWGVGLRNVRKALLNAALAPVAALRQAEREGDYTKRLVLLEERKSMPAAAVWDYYCLKAGVPLGMAWFEMSRDYERRVLSARD